MSNGVAPLSSQSAPAVSITNLRKNFGSLEVLKGVSLKANEGDVISILGASGSGKSTMLRCINMLEVPDGGDVTIGGETIKLKHTRKGMMPADQRQVDRIRSRVAMVFQSFNLWSHMTILENVIEAPVHVQKRPKAECIAEAEELLAKVGIADKRNQYPSHLSGGQQQRAAIARAIVGKPALLLADEPTGNLDTANGAQVMDILKSLNDEG
ncbi:MAG TPA: ATP-binding cassette domain-containing protein, partial [Microvirga sp.]|nr:ATP-binding cassette domain-containing protein [Microvirga sp.]